jgi:hypothetical protein
MSAILTPAATTPAPARVPVLKVTQRRVLRSEFTKFRSLRSTVGTLLAAVVLSAVHVDRVRAVVRVRCGPHRRGGLAAATIGRLTQGADNF